jgi:hypothetical protein
MGWPISREQLVAEMATALEGADDAVREAWERIRIEPERWRCSPRADESGGFWVVAEMPGAVVWYNDIEEGFNTSPFTVRGTIDEYRCNQTDFRELLTTLPEALAAEEFAARGAAAEVPAELAGPGHVVRRQTTYWELRPAGGGVARVHFTSKQETRFDAAAYDRLELFATHPLLVGYHERWASLFVAQARQGGARLLAELSAGVESATSGWRRAEEYLGLGGPTVSVLRHGHGLLLRAPESIARMAADVVRDRGAIPSLVRDDAGPATGAVMEHRPRFRALLLGRSFVIARDFRFVSSS